MLRALVVLALALAAGACAGSRTVVEEGLVRDGRVSRLRAAEPSDFPAGIGKGFTTRHLRDGSQQTYQLAFLLADHLIRRDGFGRLLEYFRAFGTRVDRHANFRAAFGQSLAAFEQEAPAHLASAVR